MSTCDFLLIGCEGCGKTTLLKQLGNYYKGIPVDGVSLNTLSTNGVELETITHKKHKYVVREIGGNFLPVWAKYYESSLMIIYMIDMANYAQLPITCVEFLNLLSHKALYKKHFLLLLNKIDQPYAMTRAMLDSVMFLDAVKKEAFSRFGQTIWIEEISAAKGVGLDKVMFWMHDTKRSLASLGSSPKGASPSPKNSHSPKGPTPYSPKGVPSPVFSSFSSSFAHNAIYEQAMKLTSSKINFINTSFSPPPSENINVHVNINTNTNNNNTNNSNNNNNDTTNTNNKNNPIITVNPTINIYTTENTENTENTKNTPPLSSSSSSISSSSIPTTNIFVSNPNSIPDDVIAIASKSKKNFSIHNNLNTNTNTNINNNNNNNNNTNTTKSFTTTTTTTENGENTNPNTNTNININDGNNINTNNITKIPNSTNTNININNPTNTTNINNPTNKTEKYNITEKNDIIKNNLGPIITGVDSPKG